ATAARSCRCRRSTCAEVYHRPMRLPLALALWVTLCACGDPFPAHNPAPPKPPPVQVVVPRPEPEAVVREKQPEPPAEPAVRIAPRGKAGTGAPAPGPAELDGTFELSADTSHASSGVIGFISVRGDKDGATVTSGETCEHCPGQALKPYARGTLPAA